LPLLSFGPSVTVPGLAYLLTPPFEMECLTSLVAKIKPVLAGKKKPDVFAELFPVWMACTLSPG
jgi:hypothetical protein